MPASKTGGSLKSVFEPAKAEAADPLMQPDHSPPAARNPERAGAALGYPAICPPRSTRRYVMR